MGTQWYRMGRDLMKIPLFATSIEKCHDILMQKGVNLKEIIYSSNEKIYDSILNSYLGIISIEIALTDVLKSMNVEPDFIIGHSVGEIACSYADGCLTVDEALSVALIRSKLIIESNVEEGAMAVIGMHFSEVEKMLPENIDIACHNSAQLTTVSGPKYDLLKFIDHLKSGQNFATEIGCSGIPFHGRYIKKIGPKLYKNLQTILTKSKIRSSKWISTTYEQEVKFCNARYQTDNFLSPVLFEEAMNRLPKNAVTIEISPHGFLESILKSSLNESIYIELTKRSRNVNKIDGKLHFMESLGRLFQSGVDMNISALYPTIDFPVSRGTPMISPLIKWNHNENFSVITSDKNFCEHFKKLFSLNDKKYEFLKYHVIDGKNLIPGAFWILTIWKSYAALFGVHHESMRVIIENIEFLQVLQVHDGKDILVTIMISRSTGRFEILENDVTLVCGTIRQDDDVKITEIDLEENSNAIYLESKDFYKHVNIMGYNIPENYYLLQQVRNDGLQAKVKITDNWALAIDAMFLSRGITLEDNLCVLSKIARIKIDPILHHKVIEDNQAANESLLEIKTSKDLYTTTCGGLEIQGNDSFPINRRLEKHPIMETYSFIPYESNQSYSQDDALKIFLQTFIDREIRTGYSIVEINYEDGDSMSVILSKIIKQQLMDFDLKLLTLNKIEIDDVEVISDKEINSFDKVDVIIKKNSANDDEFIKSIESVLNNDGVLITEEDSNVKINENSQIISKLNLDNGNTLFMLKLDKIVTEKNYKTIEITTNVDDWIQPLKNELNNDVSVIIYSQNVKEFSGILGFYKCLRMELSSKCLKCFLIEDRNAPKFDINHSFYAMQEAKGFSINIYKNGEWGNYYHLDIKSDSQLKHQRDHCFVNYLRRGDLSSLKWLQGPLNPQTTSDAMIKIQYAALNFKDVVYTVGYIKDNLNLKRQCSIGFEFSGIRTDTGERVMGSCAKLPGGLSNYYPVKDAVLFKIPDSWTLEDAATVPVVYMTVYYSFLIATQIKAGKSILIHSGAGGVGQAALHVAFAYGLEVFTTVGTEEKRKFLVKTFPQLKPENIGNSRDTTFEQMIMKNTNGKGVDYVLNSLSGNKMKASIKCLGRNGVFLEIGRVDVEIGTLIDMKFLLKNISLKLVRIDEIMDDSGMEKKNLFKIFENDLKAGIVKPINRTVYDASLVENAFRFMMTGNHIGKILLKVRENSSDDESVPLHIMPRFYCNENHSYIILGGLGGLGLEFCKWLVGRECRKIVISSSHGISNQYQAHRINFLKSFDVEIEISTDDITKKSGCKELLIKASKLGPIGGIFNLAGVLVNGIYENQTEEMFIKSMAPKAVATKHLHELSLKYCPDLKYFIVFSSISCGRGNGGQTNYGMSNSIMEEIIEMRHQMGLPAKAIQWGPVKDVGMLSHIQADSFGQYLLLSLSTIFESLDALILENAPIVACTGSLQKTVKITSNMGFINMLMNLLNIDDRKTIPMSSTLMQMGIDSLTGVELQQIVQRDYDVSLTSKDLRKMTIGELEQKIHSGDKVIQTRKEFDTVDFILEYFNLNEIINSAKSTDLIMTLNGANSGSKNLIIPGWFGLITENFIQMASHLNGSTYALQHSHIMDQIHNFKDLENVLKPEIIKFFRSCDHFVLIAHSFGVLIALILAKILEENLKIPGHIIAIDGSPSIILELIKQMIPDLNQEKHNEIIAKIINKYPKNKNIDSFDDDKKNLAESIINGLTNKFKCAVTFKEDDFSELNHTKITLLKSSDTLFTSDNNHGLSKYLKCPVDVHFINQNHNSIITASETYDIINDKIRDN